VQQQQQWALLQLMLLPAMQTQQLLASLSMLT
jgi:hypothetical protein